METLTPRQQFILSKVLNERASKIEVLHKQLDVSNRTILREVSSINKYLKKYRLNIFNDEEMNLTISGNKESIEDIKVSLRSVPVQWLLNKEQRQILIACELLINREPVKASYYSHKFNVVMGSISLDLDSIEKWAISKNLCLIRNRNLGVSIEGSEWNKRNAFIDLIFEYKSYDELLAFLYDKKDDEVIHLLFNMLFGDELTALVKHMLSQVDQESFNLNDVRYFTLFVLVLLAVKKTENNDSILLPDNIKAEILSIDEYKKIKIFTDIFKENNITMPENELIYIWFHLSNYKYFADRDYDINYEMIAKEVVREVSKKINVDIENDINLIRDLSNHFRQTFNMLDIGLKVINPLVDEIEQHYNEIFNAVNKICRLMFSRYNLRIPREEVGYITMHIDVAVERKQAILRNLRVLILCPSGLGSAKILSYKIKNKFPNIGNIDVGSLNNINTLIEDDSYDLILSTVTLDLDKKKDNLIIVSPFMSKNDIEKVNEFILNLKLDDTKNNDLGEVNLYKEEDNQYELANTIIKNLHVKKAKLDTFLQLINFIVDDIYDEGLISDKDKLKTSILKRSEKGNVVIQRTRTALIHSRTDEIRSPFLGVYGIDKPLRMVSSGFEEEDVDTFIVMIARNEESNYILNFFGKISVSLIENIEFVEFLQSNDVVAIRKGLINIVNDEGDNKL